MRKAKGLVIQAVQTLDSRTSQKCRAHDGSIVPVEDASPGDNLPPLHPNCRSTVIGSLGEGKGGQKGTRAARVGKGKTFYVPQQMQYNDYKAVYVDKTKSFASWAKEKLGRVESRVESLFTRHTREPGIETEV